MNLVMEGSDIVKLLKSPEFKEMQRRFREISTLFETMSDEPAVECRKALSGFLMGSKDEIEVEAIARQIPVWFPLLASETEEELTEYALALISYYAHKIKAD